MYKECPRVERQIAELKRLLKAYVDGLEKAKKMDDLKILPHLQTSIEDMRDIFSRDFGVLLAEYYMKWMKALDEDDKDSADYELEGWMNDRFTYNRKTARMETRTMHLEDLGVTYLPKRLTITGNLDMSMKSNHSLEDLPDDLEVQGKLTIWWRDDLIHKARFLPNGYIREIVEDMSN